LRSKRIRKVGVHVQADLTRLFNDCGFSRNDDQQFEGALELSELARERNAIERRNASLVDITAVVLKRYLPKDPAIRTSMRWDDPTLSAEYEAYAALDVYAAWAIFQSLSITPTSSTASITTPGTRVRLVTRNGTLSVAYGYISQHQPKHFNGVKVTSGRIVVTLDSIIIPAYRVRAELLSTHQDTPLSALGSQLPFSLLCCIRDLRASPTNPELNQGQSRMPLKTPSSQPAAELKSLGDSGDPPESESHQLECDKCDVVCNCEILSSESCRYDPNSEQSITSAEKDGGSLQKAQELDEFMMIGMQGVEQGVIRSRVLGDIWHLMNQFKISVHHGLRRPFSRALRDALFILDPEDVANVEGVLKMKDMTFKNAVLYFSDWVWQRVKHCVPPAEILASRVVEVFRTYGPLKDAKNGQPLFNNDSWETARTIMENIKMGYYSDPPGMKFYTFVRKDKNGLSIYRCSRGTNNVEGGIHQNIIRQFGSFNASPRLAVNLL
jgi:hypothetical protein